MWTWPSVRSVIALPAPSNCDQCCVRFVVVRSLSSKVGRWPTSRRSGSGCCALTSKSAGPRPRSLGAVRNCRRRARGDGGAGAVPRASMGPADVGTPSRRPPSREHQRLRARPPPPGGRTGDRTRTGARGMCEGRACRIGELIRRPTSARVAAPFVRRAVHRDPGDDETMGDRPLRWSQSGDPRRSPGYREDRSGDQHAGGRGSERSPYCRRTSGPGGVVPFAPISEWCANSSARTGTSTS